MLDKILKYCAYGSCVLIGAIFVLTLIALMLGLWVNFGVYSLVMIPICLTFIGGSIHFNKTYLS